MTTDSAPEADDGYVAQIPTLPWCGDCWDQAAEGSQEDRDGALPDNCEQCGSEQVFWI